MYKLAFIERWWKEHYGETNVKDINNHYIVSMYIDYDEFKNNVNIEELINNMRSNQMQKPIYKNKKLKLGIVKGYNYNNYEVCINYTYLMNIFLRKCKKYLKQKKEKNKYFTKLIIYKNYINTEIYKDVIKYF